MMRNKTTAVDAEQFADMSAGYYELRVALEHALCDLVAARGIGYLDVFLQHRIDRASDALGYAVGVGPDATRADAEKFESDFFYKSVESRTKVLREIIDRVRRDPRSPTPER